MHGRAEPGDSAADNYHVGCVRLRHRRRIGCS
jgi:hypothetical protein